MKIAILGCGIVGGSLLRILEQENIEVRAVLTRRERTDLNVRQAFDLQDILEDESIDAVVETMGGVQPAADYMLRAMRAGKHVVTANKQAVSHHFPELLETARECGVQFRFGASVGGGIPWLHNLLRTARADEIERIEGILNGTCNYILDAMTRKGLPFQEALSRAQSLGYAEADPTADIEGFDAQRKCAISASMAFGQWVRDEQVAVMGISGIEKEDIAFWERQGIVCRLMVQAARRKDGSIEACVEPMLFSKESQAAAIVENQNYVSLYGKKSGLLSFSGQGAGGVPTAMTVLGDLMDINQGARQEAALEDNAWVRNGEGMKTYCLRNAEGKRWLEKGSTETIHKRAKEEGLFAAALAEGVEIQC